MLKIQQGAEKSEIEGKRAIVDPIVSTPAFRDEGPKNTFQQPASVLSSKFDELVRKLTVP